MLKFGSTDEIALEIFLGFRSSNILRTPSEGCLHTYLTVIFLAGIVTQGQFGGHSIQALQALVAVSYGSYGSLPQVSPDVCRADKRGLLPNPAECNGLYMEEIRLNVSSVFQQVPTVVPTSWESCSSGKNIDLV